MKSSGSPYHHPLPPPPRIYPHPPFPVLPTWCFVLGCGIILVAHFLSDYPVRIVISTLLSFFSSKAGLRTLHGLGPQLRRAISGQLGSDDDELFLKEDASQKAQVNHIYLNTSVLMLFSRFFSLSVTLCFDVFPAQGILGES